MEKMKNHIFLEEDKYGIGNNIYDFDILQYLGGGDTNLYAKVKSKLDNNIYIMKIMINIKLEKYERIEKKLHILRLINHPNILKYYSSFIDNNNYYIIMEYAEGGSIKNYIKIHKILNKKIEEKKLSKLFYQSMSAVGFLHRNITTKNIFLTKDGDIKLGGFDYLCKNNDKSEKDIKPLENIAYYLSKNDFSFKLDLYSLGLVFYNLRYLNQKQIVIPDKEYNSRIYKSKDIEEDNAKLSKLSPEYYLINIFKKNQKDMLEKKIINNYNNALDKDLNSSIESVYFSLIYLFQNQCIFMGNHVEDRKINVNEEFTSKEPITQSLKIRDLYLLRKILLENNKTFEQYKEKEIPPSELIKYLIKQLHIENNYNTNNYTKVFSLINERDNKDIQINRGLILSDYESIYNQYFNSIISAKNKGLYGTYEIKDQCKNCEEINYYYESFYYITLDIDSSDNEILITDIFENNKDKITRYKFCHNHNCKNITKHEEIKSIYRFPCRLVILIKNNSQKTIKFKHTLRENYYCVAIISVIKKINMNTAISIIIKMEDKDLHIKIIINYITMI